MELCYLKFVVCFVSSDIYVMKLPDLFRYVQYRYAVGHTVITLS